MTQPTDAPPVPGNPTDAPVADAGTDGSYRGGPARCEHGAPNTEIRDALRAVAHAPRTWDYVLGRYLDETPCGALRPQTSGMTCTRGAGHTGKHVRAQTYSSWGPA